MLVTMMLEQLAVGCASGLVLGFSFRAGWLLCDRICGGRKKGK